MITNRLLAHYEQVADTPDAIVRLRRFILDLAVRGKLVPQGAKDEPASELLKQIATEKAWRLKAGEFREPSSFVKIDRKALPFEPPLHWRWAKLIEISHPSYGFAFASEKFNSERRGMPLIRIRDISNADTEAYFQGDFDASYLVTAGDYLVGMDGNFNLRRWRGKDGLLNQRVMRINGWKCGIDPEFIKLPLQFILDHLHGETSLTTVKHLSAKQVNGIEIPLPPLAEQCRIVAKVDELMGLCDQLETARIGREGSRDQLVAASLARLNAPDPEILQANARFVLDALPTFTLRPDQIKALRQAILDLAVRGKLVPQDAKGEPASELLERITKEKAQLVKAGLIPGKKEPVRDATRLGDELPVTWSPVALGKICNVVTSGSRGWAEFYSTSGPGFIRAQNIRFGRLRLDDMAFVNPPSNSEGSRTQVAKGDLLIVITGAGVTNAALLDHDLGEAYVSQHVALVRPSESQLSAWILLCLMADAGGRGELVERAYGAGKPGLNLDNIRSLSIPLPPLVEQHRIVAKVDALMALCDRLEASLTKTTLIRRRLLDALLREALMPIEGRLGSASAERIAAAPVPRTGIAVEAERSAVVLMLAYERHRSARRDKTFGHVKAQKILHLVEAEANFDLGRTPIRDAAGPNDFHHMLNVEKWAQKHKRFEFEKNGSGYTFKPLSDYRGLLDTLKDVDAATRARIENIIDIFIPMDMETSELFATVYAAWNNLLIEGKNPEDGDIVRAAREEWHPRKLKIPHDKFVAALRYLKKSGLVPNGRGKFVPRAQQQDMFIEQ